MKREHGVQGYSEDLGLLCSWLLGTVDDYPQDCTDFIGKGCEDCSRGSGCKDEQVPVLEPEDQGLQVTVVYNCWGIAQPVSSG